MKLSLNWIKEFVDIDDEIIEELPHKLTMSTAEVEEVEYKGKEVAGVVVGIITHIASHPAAEKLTVITVDTGDELVSSVCGAPNIYQGMKIPFAKVGGACPDSAW